MVTPFFVVLLLASGSPLAAKRAPTEELGLPGSLNRCRVPDPAKTRDVRFEPLELAPTCRLPNFGGLGVGPRPTTALRIATSQQAFRAQFRCAPPAGVNFERQRVVVYLFLAGSREAAHPSAVRDDGKRLHLVVDHQPACLGDASEELVTRSIAVALPASAAPIVVDACRHDCPDTR